MPGSSIAPQRPRENQGRRSQAERRAATRAKVLEGTIDIINEEGVSKVTVSWVVKKTGVSWGAAQNLFGAKHDLLVEICNQAFQSAVQRLQDLKVDRRLALEGRVRLLLEELRDIYESPEMNAATAICEDPPQHEEAHKRLEAILRDARKKLDKTWIVFFNDLDIDEKKVIVMRHFAQMALSGMSRHKALEDPLTFKWRIPFKQFSHEAFELLVAGIVQYLQSSPSTRKPGASKK